MMQTPFPLARPLVLAAALAVFALISAFAPVATAQDGLFTDSLHRMFPLRDSHADMALGDVDGDGYVDLLLGCRGSSSPFQAQNRLFLNDGSGALVDATSRLPALTEYTTGVALGDVDGDGDLDALFGNYDEMSKGWGQNQLHINDGSGCFIDTPVQIPSGSDNTTSLAIGDVDNDGDVDLFVGNSWCPYNYAQNRLHLNDGSGIFTDATSSHLPVDDLCTNCVALADLDDDGDLDAFLGNQPGMSDGRNRIYANTGSGTFVYVPSCLPSHADRTLDIAVGDVDGDGDLDVMIGNEGNAVFNSPEQNRLYVNDGTGQFSNATNQIPGEANHTYSVAFGDLDGDGDLDAVMGNGPSDDLDGQNDLLRNDGAGWFTRVNSQIPADDIETWSLAPGDLDSDGDMDIVLGNGIVAATQRECNTVYINTLRQLSRRANPRIGKPLIFDIQGPRGGAWRLAASWQRNWYPAPAGILMINVSSAVIDVTGSLGPDGTASRTFQVPQIPSLVGRSLYWQVLVAPPAKLTNLEITTFTDY